MLLTNIQNYLNTAKQVTDLDSYKNLIITDITELYNSFEQIKKNSSNEHTTLITTYINIYQEYYNYLDVYPQNSNYQSVKSKLKT